MVGIFKKFFKKEEKPKKAEHISASGLAQGVKTRSQRFFNFLLNSSSTIQDEFESIKEKCQNLQKTNYELGLKHLDEGRLSEATFRFYFTKKVWPKCYDAYYQLAYCQVLKDNHKKAKRTLNSLLKKQPNYNKETLELLEIINNKLEEEKYD